MQLRNFPSAIIIEREGGGGGLNKVTVFFSTSFENAIEKPFYSLIEQSIGQLDLKIKLIEIPRKKIM